MSPLNPLFKMAVMAGVESAVQLHIDRGDDLNARDGNGLTLLMLSATRNKSAICQLLLNAGADDSLLDPVGRTAHAIAVEVGADQAAQVLAPPTSSPEIVASSDAPLPSPVEHAAAIDSPAESAHPDEGTVIVVEATPSDSSSEIEVDGFDLFGWEPEETLTPPELDPTLAAEASAVQAAISAHEPIDSSTDWDDVDAFLPEQSVPFIRKDDIEARENLRLTLLRAYREGSVPHMAIEALSTNDDGTANPEFEALLSLVVNDLAAEIDERFEYRTSQEDFTVFISPYESEDEEQVIDTALQFIDTVASRRSEPLRIYLKEFQKIKLISGDEEVALAKQMEKQHAHALEVLASWPEGIEKVLAAGRLVQQKARTLSSVSMGPLEPQPDLDASDDEPTLVSEMEATDDETDDEAEEAAITSDSAAHPFFDGLLRLTELKNEPSSADSKKEIQEQLGALRLSTGFLFELTKAACNDPHESACEFAAAMAGYLQAREQMAAANLKLAFHIAKKYLYSGEPLDDLVQEANIGLMKAVERFDWRRGYKFSTYATWWIRQQVGRSVADTARTIRIPVHVYETLQKLYRETRAFEAEVGRKPEADEIADRLGISLRKLRSLERIPQEPATIDDDFDDELIDASSYDSLVSPDPFEVSAEAQFCRIVDTVISCLKLKEQKVTRLRFGIGVNSSSTLEEVGVAYGVTRERIRQIEAKALRKLRHPNQSDQLHLAFFGKPPIRPKHQVSSDASEDQTDEGAQVDDDASVEIEPASVNTPEMELTSK
ncbi:RNA polymerase primary sigma factor [Duganella sacchari]|uniref:RNA polymerase primary sigma factor n=1 Tax=Duganella sacchari TaxID=551987 RepID=A0A1M7R546_9BURK|nr:sigma-70 family RNA polymerase sigma factor [Duganella sacchari]SHN40580.1 RNA polymerase primary sigma factor [Duganella sacchari]